MQKHGKSAIFRKQYVIITDVKENLNYKEWRKQCQ